ncbi:hypothetical protein [Rhizobium sp. LjRoot254]|uniref:hypothetical protein n=1 Tax=Rhizobium sp. LjRoot254 TaxID=3342297 RepID=UPI003ED00EF7
MRLKMLLTACLMLLPAIAVADPTGTFQVLGKNPNGQEYKGVVKVARTGETYSVAWNVGGTEFIGTDLGAKFVGDRFQMGPASPDDTAISVGYISGQSFGMAMYFQQPDGTWQGIWTYGGSDKASLENWVK